MAGKVNSSRIECIDGSVIGVLELDNPEALNALSYGMIEQLYHQLIEWREDESIVAIFLHASGEKAFCAGGDIQAIYRALENKEQHFDAAQKEMETFFILEYQCDYLIHTYSKPIIAWGHGYLMGGGVGLFMGASHRVIDNTTRFAMPETKIGLYPDVGATYFLNKLPKHLAMFIGLTACQINAADMKGLGLCHWVASSEQKANLLNQLTDIGWQSESNIAEKLDSILAAIECQDIGSGWLMEHEESIAELCTGSLSEMVQAIDDVETEDRWFSGAQKSLRYSSPLSLNILYQQLTSYQGMTLKECFDLEYNLTLRCGLEGDFREGVRALIIDKSMDPKWLYSDVSEVSERLLKRFFAPVDSSEFPLTNPHLEPA
ncbi:enoyl-CoA hydratase/isomerase family protein [Vibrio sp. HN007]|uniref:enoyl-CoA hydratase/isomerase family protein n=1 Tax=Vibrio iocasae TaxID=3098914 RepID=UPI0035D5044F